jgi:hypothetical protein
MAADPLAIIATVLGVVSTGIGIASRLWPSSPPAQRDTSLPAAPPQPSLHECAGCALVRAEVRDMADAIGEVNKALVRVETKLDERTVKGGRSNKDGGHRESST